MNTIDTLRDLAEKHLATHPTAASVEYHFNHEQAALRHPTAASAVYHAAFIALKNFDENEINEWDLKDTDSCGVNRYIERDTGLVFWDAIVEGHAGDDYTRSDLEGVLKAEDWFDEDWSEEV